MPIYKTLVRDRIPQVIEASGNTCVVEVLDQASQELAELADLVEVALALVKAKGVTPAEFEALRHAKESDRSAFDQRLFLVRVNEP